MESCPYVGYDICIPALLSWGYMVVMVVLYIIIFTLLMVYYEDKTSKKCKVVQGYYIIYILCSLCSVAIMIVSLTVFDNCSTSSQTYAIIFGYISSLFTVIQYLPQIVTTFKCKTSGSFSFLANMIGVAGQFVMVAFMAFSTGQDFTSYLRFILSFVLQSILALMQIYYDYIPKWCNKQNDDSYKRLIDDENDVDNENKNTSTENNNNNENNEQQNNTVAEIIIDK